MNYFKKHSSAIILFLILVTAFFSRLYFFFRGEFITTDGVNYVLAGKNLIENGKYEVFGNPELIFPPGYPIFIGIVNYFFDNLLFSARFTSFIFGFLAVYLFYLVGKEIFNKTAGLFAAFFAATHYMFIVISVESWSESLYSFFVLLIVYIYLKLLDKNKIWMAILLGFTIGYAYLIRIEGIIFIILPFLFFIFKKKQLGTKKAIKSSLVVIFSFILIIVPYICFLYQHTGSLILTSKTNSNIMAGLVVNGKDFDTAKYEDVVFYEKVRANYNEEINNIEIPEEFDNLSISDLFLRDPAEFSKRYFVSLRSEIRILLFDLQVDILLIFILVSLIFLFKKRKYKQKAVILFIFPLAFLFIFPLFHIESRYLVQILIFLILLSSLGYSLRDKFTFLRYKGFILSSEMVFKVLKVFVIFAILAQFFVSMVYYSYFTEPSYSIEHKIAGEFLKNSRGYNFKEDIIMSRKPFVSFYAKSKKGNVDVPWTTTENVIKFAKAQNVSYIIIDERYLGIRENYKELADLNSYSKEIELFYNDDSIKSIRIFEVQNID